MTKSNASGMKQTAPAATVASEGWGGRRIAAGLTVLVFAILFACSAIGALTGDAPALLRVGLGRLCDYLLENGVPGAGVLAFLERGHFAATLLVGALLLLFGRSSGPQPGYGQHVVFHRRASMRRQLPALFGAIALLLAGQWLASAVHPIVAGLIELPATSLIGWVTWHAVIPETRPTLSILVDDNDGFANRIEIADGIYNRRGSCTIRHDQLREVRMLQSTWTRLFYYRDLLIEAPGAPTGSVRLDAIAPPGELREIAGYLNGSFKYALTQTARDWRSRFPAAVSR
ncbi:MAG: hypothetical protein WDN24_10655 [Sphingomonas sp.]